MPLDSGRPGSLTAAILEDCTPRVLVEPARDAGRGDAHPVAAVLPEDPALIVYTSGTTGRPKGVVHAHRTFSPALPSFLRDVVGVGPGDRVLAAARTATALGFFLGLARPLAAGATAVLSAARTTPRGTLDALVRDGVTVLAGVPMHWAQIASVLRHDPDMRSGLPSLRATLSTGDRCSPGLARETADLGIILIDALGRPSAATSTSRATADGTLCARQPRRRGAGRPVRGAHGAALGSDALRGARVLGPPGAHGPAAPRALDAHRGCGRPRGGRPTGCSGRADDLFKVSGRLVSPLEIERALAEHPLVTDAAVVGSAQRGRVRPAAFVVTASPEGLAPPGLARELRRHVARRLSPELAPGRVAVLETLPRLAGGKLDRRALSAVAAGA